MSVSGIQLGTSLRLNLDSKHSSNKNLFKDKTLELLTDQEKHDAVYLALSKRRNKQSDDPEKINKEAVEALEELTEGDKREVSGAESTLIGVKNIIKAAKKLAEKEKGTLLSVKQKKAIEEERNNLKIEFEKLKKSDDFRNLQDDLNYAYNQTSLGGSDTAYAKLSQHKQLLGNAFLQLVKDGKSNDIREVSEVVNDISTNDLSGSVEDLERLEKRVDDAIKVFAKDVPDDKSQPSAQPVQLKLNADEAKPQIQSVEQLITNTLKDIKDPNENPLDTHNLSPEKAVDLLYPTDLVDPDSKTLLS